MLLTPVLGTGRGRRRDCRGVNHLAQRRPYLRGQRRISVRRRLVGGGLESRHTALRGNFRSEKMKVPEPVVKACVRADTIKWCLHYGENRYGLENIFLCFKMY
jgi:hypothetical protein